MGYLALDAKNFDLIHMYRKTFSNKSIHKCTAGWQWPCSDNQWECWAKPGPRSQMILTDQSWHTVELWVIGALSLPRFHSAWLQMEDVFLKWENHTETAINSGSFFPSLKFPVGRTKQRMCSWETGSAWAGMKHQNNERACVQTEKCMQGRRDNFKSIFMPFGCGKECGAEWTCWHNKVHAKQPSIWWGLWPCRPPADTCNPGLGKQTWNGG